MSNKWCEKHNHIRHCPWCEIEGLNVEIERLKKAREWRPIETAPKDGSNILVLNNDGKTYQAEWGERFSKWYFATADQHGCGCCGGDNDEPTHWMPLPEPPGEGEL